MPRSFQEIIEHADELSAQLDELQPRTEDIRDARTLRNLRQAVLKRAAAESEIAELVTVARSEGQAWSAIGAMLGTSGEAARQRYGGYREARVERKRPRPALEGNSGAGAGEGEVRNAEVEAHAVPPAVTRAPRRVRLAGLVAVG